MVRRTKAQALATRNTIIETAEKVIEARGLSSTTLQDIADAAGMTRGAIYWHFKNKSELFTSIMERAFIPFESALLLIKSNADEPPLSKLRQHSLYLFKCVSGDEQLRRLLEIVTQKIEYTDEIITVRERIKRLRMQHIAMIEQCLEPTSISQKDKPILAIGLHVIVLGLIRNWIFDPPAFDLVEAGQVTVDAYLQGLTPSISEQSNN